MVRFGFETSAYWFDWNCFETVNGPDSHQRRASTVRFVLRAKTTVLIDFYAWIFYYQEDKENHPRFPSGLVKICKKGVQ